MDLELENKIAIVTGASKGMGLACCHRLAMEGVKIIMVARTASDLENAAADIRRTAGTEVVDLSGDVADPDLPPKVIGAALNRWGKVDILINNAGGPPPGSFLAYDDDTWQASIEQNLMSVIRFSRAAAEEMKRNRWGRIINISSTIAKEPTPNMVISATLRAGVSAFAKSISTELAPHNITVNTICPGGVMTDRLVSLVRKKAAESNESFENLMKQNENTIPANRFASPEEIADVAVFLSSQRAAYVTGMSIMVDGGLTKGVF